MKKAIFVVFVAAIVFGSATNAFAQNSGNDRGNLYISNNSAKHNSALTVGLISKTSGAKSTPKLSPTPSPKSTPVPSPKTNNGQTKGSDQNLESVRKELIGKCDTVIAQFQKLKSYIVDKNGKLLVEFKDAATAKAAIKSIDEAIANVTSQKSIINKATSSNQLKDMLADLSEEWMDNQVIMKRITGLTSAARLKEAYDATKLLVDKLGVGITGLSGQTKKVDLNALNKEYSDLKAKLTEAKTVYLSAVSLFSTITDADSSDKTFKTAQEKLTEAKDVLNDCVEKVKDLLNKLKGEVNTRIENRKEESKRTH